MRKIAREKIECQVTEGFFRIQAPFGMLRKFEFLKSKGWDAITKSRSQSDPAVCMFRLVLHPPDSYA
jgi:hypothetical protein